MACRPGSNKLIVNCSFPNPLHGNEFQMHFCCILCPKRWALKTGWPELDIIWISKNSCHFYRSVFTLCFIPSWITTLINTPPVHSAPEWRPELIRSSLRAQRFCSLFYIGLPWIPILKKMTLKSIPFHWYFSFNTSNEWHLGTSSTARKYSRISGRHKDKCTSSTHIHKTKWPSLA